MRFQFPVSARVAAGWLLGEAGYWGLVDSWEEGMLGRGREEFGIICRRGDLAGWSEYSVANCRSQRRHVPIFIRGLEFPETLPEALPMTDRDRNRATCIGPRIRR